MALMPIEKITVFLTVFQSRLLLAVLFRHFISKSANESTEFEVIFFAQITVCKEFEVIFFAQHTVCK